MLLDTLRRYHCLTKKPSYYIYKILSPHELHVFQPKAAIDLGMYPMPYYLLDDPIIFKSVLDEQENGRKF